jgi:hypothetical protein
MKMRNTEIINSLRASLKVDLDNVITIAKTKAADYIHSLNLTKHPHAIAIDIIHRELQSFAEEYKNASYKKYILFSDDRNEISLMSFSEIILSDKSNIDDIEKAICFAEKYNALTKEQENLRPSIKTFLSHNTPFEFFTPDTPIEHFYKKKESHLHSVLKQVYKILYIMQSTLTNEYYSSENIKRELILCQKKEYSNFIVFKKGTLKYKEYKKEITEKDILDIPSNTEKQNTPLLQTLALRLYINWLNYPTGTYKEIRPNNIFNKMHKKQIQESERIIKKIEANIHTISTESIEKKLKALEDTSKRFSCPVISEITNNKHHIKSIFFASVLINADLYISLHRLRYTTIMSKLYDFYIDEYFKRNQELTTLSQALSHMASMGTNDDIFNPLIDIINKNMELVNINESPTFSLLKETVNAINKAFESAAYELEEKYDYLDINKVALHSAATHKHLHKFINRLSRNNLELNPKAKELENILTNAIDYQKTLSTIDNIDINIPHQNKKKTHTNNTESFGYKKSDKEILLRIIKALHYRITLLKDDESINTLVNILTSEKIYSHKDKIYVTCQTNQFAYIITKLRPLFKNLEFSKIERTKLFFSNKNTLLTASNLYSADVESLNQKNEINNVFKQFNL